MDRDEMIENLKQLGRDIGTVRSVAARRHAPEDSDHIAMLRRLYEWGERIHAMLAALAAPVAADHGLCRNGMPHYCANCGNRFAAPVAADPPSLVALVQEWQAAHHRMECERSAVYEDVRRAESALLAWTPAKAETLSDTAKASILAAQARSWPPAENPPASTPAAPDKD